VKHRESYSKAIPLSIENASLSFRYVEPERDTISATLTRSSIHCCHEKFQ